MDILSTIMQERHEEVAQLKKKISSASLRDLAAGRKHHSLSVALRSTSPTRIIAEVKKASPSAGLLRADYRPEETARSYQQAGAVAISVLTEPLHFQGSGEHLRAVRQAVEIPVLRKDFICDSYQIHEAAAWGADVVLLIVAALDKPLLGELSREVEACGLETLVEVHTLAELETALALEGGILGVNSRNLKTLKTDLATARELAVSIPEDRLSIAESGIRTRADIEMLESAGYSGFLIGETLLRAPDPGKMLEALVESCS